MLGKSSWATVGFSRRTQPQGVSLHSCGTLANPQEEHGFGAFANRTLRRMSGPSQTRSMSRVTAMTSLQRKQRTSRARKYARRTRLYNTGCRISLDSRRNVLKLKISMIQFHISKEEHINGTAFRDVMPCSPTKVHRSFGRKCYLHLQGRNVCQANNQRLHFLQAPCW
jgi:hypothetical protein